MKYKSICLLCRKTFCHNKSRKNSPHKFCSQECHLDYQKKNASYHFKKCKNCGKSFLNKRNPKSIFCSPKCRAHYNSIKRTKEIKQLEPILKQYYFEKNLSTLKIASKLNVTKTTILKWFKKLGIQSKEYLESRHYTNFRMPSKEVLYNQTLIQGKTYSQLAKLYKCDPSTIGNWLKLYQIPRPRNYEKHKGLDFKEPTKTQLEHWYIEQQLSTRQIGKLIDLSDTAISKRLRKFNIPIRYSGFNFKRYTCQDGHIVRSVYEQRVDDWLFVHKLLHQYEPQLPWNNRQRADFKVNGYYIEVWGITSQQYKERKLAKRRQYKKFNLKLIQIYPIDFQRGINRKLNKLLSKNDKQNYEQLLLK